MIYLSCVLLLLSSLTVPGSICSIFLTALNRQCPSASTLTTFPLFFISLRRFVGTSMRFVYIAHRACVCGVCLCHPSMFFFFICFCRFPSYGLLFHLCYFSSFLFRCFSMLFLFLCPIVQKSSFSAFYFYICFRKKLLLLGSCMVGGGKRSQISVSDCGFGFRLIATAVAP